MNGTSWLLYRVGTSLTLQQILFSKNIKSDFMFIVLNHNKDNVFSKIFVPIHLF